VPCRKGAPECTDSAPWRSRPAESARHTTEDCPESGRRGDRLRRRRGADGPFSLVILRQAAHWAAAARRSDGEAAAAPRAARGAPARRGPGAAWRSRPAWAEHACGDSRARRRSGARHRRRSGAPGPLALVIRRQAGRGAAAQRRGNGGAAAAPRAARGAPARRGPGAQRPRPTRGRRPLAPTRPAQPRRCAAACCAFCLGRPRWGGGPPRAAAKEGARKWDPEPARIWVQHLRPLLSGPWRARSGLAGRPVWWPRHRPGKEPGARATAARWAGNSAPGGAPLLGPDLGPELGPDLGLPYKGLIRGPNQGPTCGPQIWGPDVGPRSHVF
jgi:hypothetical protein